MSDTALLGRGLDAARLMLDVYNATGEAGITHPEILAAGGVEVEHSLNHKGVEAYLVQWRGQRWLVVPGTDSIGDWARNLSNVMPWRWAKPAAKVAAVTAKAQVPAVGASGALWGYGFLTGAQDIFAWLEDKPAPEMSVGHSLGAAMVAILAWSRNIGETHAIACPGVRYGLPEAVPGLNVWQCENDIVCFLPHLARHIGAVRWLPKLEGVRGESHRIPWYIDRFERALAS